MVEIDEFKEYDKNGDWKLTSDEAPVSNSPVLANFRQNINQTLQSQSRKPGTSGTTNEAEMTAWAVMRIKSKDKDNDGTLSPAEFGQGDFSSVDTNQDGKIDVKEYLSFRLGRQ